MEKHTELMKFATQNRQFILEDNSSCPQSIPEVFQQNIRSTFQIRNLCCINDCQAYPTRFQFCTEDGVSRVRVDCKVRIDYTDCCGKQRCCEQISSAIFSNIPGDLCTGSFQIAVDNPPLISCFKNRVSVITTIFLKQ